jgi:hypothetical protein
LDCQLFFLVRALNRVAYSHPVGSPHAPSHRKATFALANLDTCDSLGSNSDCVSCAAHGTWMKDTFVPQFVLQYAAFGVKLSARRISSKPACVTRIADYTPAYSGA